MRAIGNRQPPKPGTKTRQKSVASQLLSVIMNKSPNSHELSRVDTDAWGTFEGDASPNIRFPLNLGAVGDTEEGGGTKRYVPTSDHREQFLSVLGKHLKQEGQAASQFVPTDLGSHDTFSILVRRYDKVGITERQIDLCPTESICQAPLAEKFIAVTDKALSVCDDIFDILDGFDCR